MAEQHATPRNAPRPAASSVWSESSTATGRLACYACKGRKVKCDRELPICSLCHKLNVVCSYPAAPQKPGPKTGSRQDTKRRRLDLHDGTSTSIHDISLSATGDVVSSTITRQSRPAASSASCDSPVQDGTLPGSSIAAPEGGLSTSSSASSPPSTAHPTSAPTFSRIMYPSHEAQTRPQSPSTVHTPSRHQYGATGITVQSVCDALRISRTAYDMLMDSYFTNMTSFSLFRPGSIEPKFEVMQHHSDAEALVAAVFSFSARHCRDPAIMGQANHCPDPSYFARIASTQLDESVDRYGDMRPPFWLLQAGILVTFYQLTLSVRSKSWKKLGDCIRYSYDMNLHIVDANHEPTSTMARDSPDMRRWALLEERRRAWWAVWEMDVFASTIRRLPTAVDPSQNLTLLPVSDSCWFDGIYQESCFLAEDCSLRWKHLARSGNRSAKAWFIVVNSLMRNMQRIVYPAGLAMQSANDKQDELDIMANCLYCTVTSLPANLSYQGETLNFRPKASPQDRVNPRQEHADKYALHLMTQLCRFMIYHHKICARAPWLAQQQKDASDGGDDQGPHARQASSEWSNYMDASDEIISVVRNSARNHCRYVNPFLANTLWFAAAAQCACKVFGPPSFNKRLTSSNLDMLKLTIDGFISFWGGMESLKGKLARIESALQNLMTRPNGHGNGDAGGGSDQHPPRRGHPPAAQRNATHDLSNRSAAAHIAADPRATTSQDRTLPGTEPLLLVPGVASSGWTDPKWPSFGPDLCDFTQPYTMGQDMYGPDPMDFSPFGLEELLMAGTDFQA